MCVWHELNVLLGGGGGVGRGKEAAKVAVLLHIIKLIQVDLQGI